MNSHEIVIRRNKFYKDLVHWQFILALTLIAGLIINYFFIKHVFYQSSRPVYFMNDKSGRYLADTPRYEPVYTDEDVEAWATVKILKVLELNYKNYEKILEKSAVFFDPVGHVKYINALKKTRVAEALIANQYLVQGVVTEPLKVTKKVIIDGVHYWILKGNITLNYINSKNIDNPFKQELFLTIAVNRQSFYLYEDGISLMTVIA